MTLEVRSNEKDIERLVRLISMKKEWAWFSISSKYGCALGSVECVLIEIHVQNFKAVVFEMGSPYDRIFGYAIEDY